MRALLASALLLAAAAAVAPSASADPACGPWAGNQAIKGHWCVDPGWAPECPLYYHYYTGGHQEHVCVGADPGALPLPPLE